MVIALILILITDAFLFTLPLSIYYERAGFAIFLCVFAFLPLMAYLNVTMTGMWSA